MVTSAPLNDAQRDLLLHVARYRLTVEDAVHYVFYPDKTRDAARKALERLEQKKFLSSTTLRGRSFYQLTPKATALLGLPRTRSDALGGQSLVVNFAMLAFCCLGSTLRERLTPQEFKAAFPEFADAAGISASHNHYYYDRHDGRWRLAHATVDTGADTSSVKRKCRGIVKHAAQTPALRDVLEQGCFMVTVLTGEESKAVTLAESLCDEETRAHYRVAWVPQLAEVL